MGCKWIYKRKEGIPWVEKPRYKARLVAKGYTQVEGIDYKEIFSPIVKHFSIRILLALVAFNDMEFEQMDVKTTFFYGDLKENIYMDQLEGFIFDKNKNKVYLSRKSLYGLKQSSRQWYKRCDEYIFRVNFRRSAYDNCVYIKHEKGINDVFLLLYVDDILIACKYRQEIQKIESVLGTEFEITDLGQAEKILGINIRRSRSLKTLHV